MTMVGRQFWAAVGAVLVMGAVAPDADAQRRPRHDQEAAREGRENRTLLPAREIERRVIPMMRGAQYLGFDFDGASGVYTLRFMKGVDQIWVDVDGRSGKILRRTDR